MADQIRERVDLFNELLAQVDYPYRVDIVRPGDLLPADKNAHFMTGQMFQQLVANIKKDRALSSVPFCWKDEKGAYHILSGHHRVDAAKAAGLEWFLILYTDQALSRQERIAIQLSHNAIFGQDEPTLLRELWNELSTVDLKAYAGLDDQLMQSYAPIKIGSLGEKAIGFQEITLAFFPSEIERVQAVFEQIKARKRTRYAAQVEQFDRFVDRLMDFKEASGIYNSATAILAILDMVEEWLASQQDDEQGVANAEA